MKKPDLHGKKVSKRMENLPFDFQFFFFPSFKIIPPFNKTKLFSSGKTTGVNCLN